MKFSSGTNNKPGNLLVSTAYLPPVSYVSACVHADDVCIESHETYTKQTIRNHCLICGPNGKQVLSIPVIKVNGNHTMTKDIRLSDSIPWQKMHWRSIRTAYSNSPFFLYYSDCLAPFFEKKQEFLLDFNSSLLETIFRLLKENKPVTTTEKFEKAAGSSNDYRSFWGKKSSVKRLDFPEYTQVFSQKNGFLQDASIIDLIFNLGPEAREYLDHIKPE